MNTVEYMGSYGGDVTHALSAWTSTEHKVTEERQKRIGPLLKRLATDGHHTPFEKSLLHFAVRCDTASHIHLLKHRIGVSVNGESARYKQLRSPTFYIPDDWPLELRSKVTSHLYKGQQLYEELMDELTEELGRKRAKESARFVLPYANQLDLDVSFNWRSFWHFYDLRAKDDAQEEIRFIAEEMLFLIKEIPGNPFKLTIEAFGL